MPYIPIAKARGYKAGFGKAPIISRIYDPIIKNKPIQTVVDLFAGTGSVGYDS